MKWFGYIAEVIAAVKVAVPLIAELVKQFESPGFGEEKLKAVLNALEAALEGFGIRESIITMIVSGATGIINAYVALKNIIGEFKHKGDSE